jgi:hypothetical protein
MSVSRATTRWGILIVLALTGLGGLVTAGPAAAAEYCGSPSTSGGYSVTACSGYSEAGSYSYGYLYVTLPAGHGNCMIRGKVIFVDNTPFGVAQTWACPAGAVTNARYDIDYAANGSTFTRASILNAGGVTLVSAESPGA